MSKLQNVRNVKILWGLICTAIIVGIIFHIKPLITGIPELDGMFAISLGFYICSRASANFLNAILFEFNIHRWQSLTQTDFLWLGLNALVMLSGFSLIITGLYRFFSRAF
jgi:hypothetical protein